MNSATSVNIKKKTGRKRNKELEELSLCLIEHFYSPRQVESCQNQNKVLLERHSPMLCSGIQIVDLSPRNKEQLDAFKYQSGPRLVAGDCVGQTTGGVLFSNVTEETLNYQSWE